MEMKTYQINESLARSAKNANSFSDYTAGEATNGYYGYLKRFNEAVEELIEENKQSVNDEVMELINYYCDKYAKKLAFAINKENSIEAMCPSIMISGAGNFPVRKKEKQNSMRHKFWQEYGSLFDEHNYYYNKIKNILTNKVIASDDALAIEKLEAKIADLEESQKLMKDVNAYYRKNNTLDGCDLLSEEELAKIKNNMQYHSWYDAPFAPFTLTNNNANIKRLKERLDDIKRLKERAEQAEESKYIQVEGLKVVEDATDMRIRIIFDDIPDADTRTLLKSNGFKWSPKNSAWQRQLTNNGIYATKQVLKKIQGSD